MMHSDSACHPYIMHSNSAFHPYMMHSDSAFHPYVMHSDSAFHPYIMHSDSAIHLYMIHSNSAFHPKAYLTCTVHLHETFHKCKCLKFCQKWIKVGYQFRIEPASYS